MTDRVVFEQRASTVLYHYLRSVARPGIWLMPASVCPIVPAVFKRAKIDFEFVDIDRQTLCMDSFQTFSRLKNEVSRYAGVLFVRSYGHSGDFSHFFRGIKAIDANLKVIDDRCLAHPRFTSLEQNVDLELYSSGYSKFVELGWGGWGILSGGELYLSDVQAYEPEAHEELVEQFRMVLKERRLFNCPQTRWLDTRFPEISAEAFRCMVVSRIEESARHRDRLNAILTLPSEHVALNGPGFEEKLSSSS